MRGIFFPLAHGAPLPAGMAALLEGSSVWLTARSEDEISRLSAALPQGADFAGVSVTGGAALADLAPAVIECAEALGGVDAVVFARRCRRRSVSSSTYRRTTLRRTPLR